MLKQAQKKIMSVKEFTNRLTFFTNALEECARAYENSTAGDRIKRTDTRDGFGMLLFLPPKPTDDHQKMYDNIVCHWFYRQELEKALIERNRAHDELVQAEATYTEVAAEAKRANEALSKAKQQLDEGKPSNPAVIKAEKAQQEAESKLASARAIRKQEQASFAAADKRCAEIQKTLDNLLKARQKARQGKAEGSDDPYSSFAEMVRELNRLPKPPSPPDASGLTGPVHSAETADASRFDDIIGRSLPTKKPTPTDISRLRTDASNSSILNDFIVANSVLAPAYAKAGFPPCHTSLIRDSDQAFSEAIIQAARKRIMLLIAEPELAFGSYEGKDDRAALLEALGLSPDEIDENEDAPDNILFELVTSEAFPIMAEEMLKPAVLEGLARFGDESAQEDFSRKLTVLSYDEQLAREGHAHAIDTPFAQTSASYAAQLKARGEVLAFMLSAALLGGKAVESYPVNMANIQKIVTGQANSMLKKAGKASAAQQGAQALLVEQIPNQEGSFSFGKTIPLTKGPTLIGRAPFGNKQESIIVPAGISPYPGLADFAANVSRAHALIEACEEGWRISDAGSSFGTAVKRLGKEPSCIVLEDDEPLLLQNGDVIVLAPIVREDGSCDIDMQLGFSYRFELM